MWLELSIFDKTGEMGSTFILHSRKTNLITFAEWQDFVLRLWSSIDKEKQKSARFPGFLSYRQNSITQVDVPVSFLPKKFGLQPLINGVFCLILTKFGYGKLVENAKKNKKSLLGTFFGIIISLFWHFGED